MSNHHSVKRLTAPDGSSADIDVAIVPLIESLWDAGYETVTSCQDLGESISGVSERRSAYWKGYVLVELPVPDTRRLIRQVSGAPQFRDHMHWTDPGAWEISVPIIPPTGIIIDLAQVRFPNTQVEDLVKVLSRPGA